MKKALRNYNILDNSDLYLCLCGIEKCLPGHFWGPGVIPNYSFHYIISGKGLFRSKDNMFELGAGQVFFIRPNTLCYYKADEKDPWTYCWVSFNGKNAEYYINRTGLSMDNPVFYYGNKHTLVSCVRSMLDYAKKSKSSDIILTGQLYQFISCIVEASEYSPSTDKIHDWSNSYVLKAVKYIQLNYSSDINIGNLAEDLNINQRYLSSLFKKILNSSPQQFLINTRIHAACNLMSNNHLSIGDIARSVGYSDPFMFSRIFKKKLGVSPSSYRKKISNIY